MTLDEVVSKIVKPLGITKIAIHADKSTAPKKFSIEPGQTAWSALMKVAEVNGLWPWIAPDGTLIIGGPDYSAAPVGSLVMGSDGTGNLLQLGKLTSIAGRYSQVTVLSQGHGTATHNGAHNRHGTATDTGMTLYRPFIEVMGDTDNDDMATARARKILSDSRLKGLTLTATVRGVRTAQGTVWQPGQRVAVKSEPHDIDAIYFIMARRIFCGRGRELVTSLTLKEDGIWTPDAYPKSRHKKKGKRPKTSTGPTHRTFHNGRYRHHQQAHCHRTGQHPQTISRSAHAHHQHRRRDDRAARRSGRRDAAVSGGLPALRHHLRAARGRDGHRHSAGRSHQPRHRGSH